MQGGSVFDRGRHRRAAIALAGLLALTGCGWLDDTFQTCRHLKVDLENRANSGQPVHIAVDDESYGPENLIPWLSSRRVEVCVERGDVERFRAGMGPDTFFIAHCPVTITEEQFEATVARVVWDRGELRCENW
jgi:hypothetical protein